MRPQTDGRSRFVWTFARDRSLFLAAFLIALFAGAFLVRVWGMSKTHSWDEWVYLQNGLVICCGKTNYSELEFRPPLISLIYAGVFLLRHSIFAAGIVAALMNAAGAVFIFLAGRMTMGRIAAGVAGVLLAFSPFFIGVFPVNFDSDTTGNSLLTDSPALTLIVVALWILLGAKPSMWRFFSGGVVLALCVLMRFGSIPSVAMLMLLLPAVRTPWKGMLACVGGLAAGLAPYLMWSKITYGGFLYTLQAGWAHVEGPSQPFMFFLQNAPIIFTWVAVVGLVSALIFQIVRVARTRWRLSDFGRTPTEARFIGYLWFWLFSGLLFFSTMPHKEPRYILPLAPPVLLLAGWGLGQLCLLATKPMRIVTYSALGFVLVLTILPMRERLKEPFINRAVTDQEAASYLLESSVPAGTVLYMSYEYPPFAYYTNFHIHELSDVGPALYADMEQIPPGEVLIVYRKAEAPAQSDVAWVNANPKFRRIGDYPSLVVYRSVARGANTAR